MTDLAAGADALGRADHQAALADYLEAGRRRAVALGNRGPIRFDERGQLHPDILDAYWEHGFYVFEDLIGDHELLELREGIEETLVDRGGRATGRKRPSHGGPEALPLLLGVGELVVAVRDLDAVDEELEALRDRGRAGAHAGHGGPGRGKVVEKGGRAVAHGSQAVAGELASVVRVAGRFLQGAGAIAGTVMALAADLTSEEQRTKGMAVIGASIQPTGP